jgi:hypothetical protein
MAGAAATAKSPGVSDSAATAEPAAYLARLAERVVSAYRRHTNPRAILVAGSGAGGEVDRYSDLDLLLYYDEPPSPDACVRARQDLGADRFRPGDDDETGFAERFYVEGIQCQLGHTIISGWERELERVVDHLELAEPLLKAVGGFVDGRALHGEELIERWRAKAAFTESLQRAMIQKRWQFFPLWYFADKLDARDAVVWRHDILVRAAYNLLGVLAGLNRLYFSTFEFKRMRSFIARMEEAPPDLADRLEALFGADARAATAELERLVAETQALVARRFPDLDVPIQWGGVPTPPGAREPGWSIPPSPSASSSER